MLARGPLGHLCCVPLTSQIHEGVVFSNRDRRTLLDKFAKLFLSVVSVLKTRTVLVVDAYLTLLPLELIACYGYRFKIEVAFKQALYTVGSYAYHIAVRWD